MFSASASIGDTAPSRFDVCCACMVTLTANERCAFCDEGADLFTDITQDQSDNASHPQINDVAARF